MSRQSDYQARRRAEGRCIQCGATADGCARCPRCLKKQRLRMRARGGFSAQKPGGRGRPRASQ